MRRPATMRSSQKCSAHALLALCGCLHGATAICPTSESGECEDSGKELTAVQSSADELQFSIFMGMQVRMCECESL